MAVDPVTQGFIAQAIPSVVTAVTRGGPRRQFKWNMRAAYKTNEMNLQNQEATLQKNLRIQQEQREYDSPAAQMARYKAAGLNPHLIYGGSGSSAGGAFPVDAGSPGSANIQPPNAAWPDVSGAFLRAGQMSAQTDLANARAGQVAMETAYKSVLLDIAKTNPMLNPEVAGWVATSMQELARVKTMESRSWLADSADVQGEKSNIYRKVQADVDSMTQRLGLNTADLLIKNRILESKEFANAILEIQKKWMVDNEITPQVGLSAGMMILKILLGAGLQK